MLNAKKYSYDSKEKIVIRQDALNMQLVSTTVQLNFLNILIDESVSEPDNHIKPKYQPNNSRY